MLLAYFGFLNSTKGLDDLLQALANLKQQERAPKLRLVMVGGGLGSSDPTNRHTAAAIEKLASQLKVKDDLIWTGYLQPQCVSAALLSADFAVLPYSDGASFRRGSLLAALEHGLPVITTTPNKQNPPTAIVWPRLVEGENALLVSPGDATALQEAIMRLATQPELRAKLARGASELAGFFDWERIAAMHADLYDRIRS